MRTVSIRIGLGFVLAIFSIGLLQMSAISDALLSFAAAGVVPGTDIVLSPNATLWTLGVFLAAAVMSIFRHEMAGLLRRPVPELSEAEVSREAGPKSREPNFLTLKSSRALWLAVWKISALWAELTPKIAVIVISANVWGRRLLKFAGLHARRVSSWALAKTRQYETGRLVLRLLQECGNVLLGWQTRARGFALRVRIQR